MKLIVGCGYLGSRVARLWQARGEGVAVVTRCTKRASDFQSAGLLPFVADVTDPSSLVTIARMEAIDTVLYAVGYDRAAGKPRREVYVEGLRNLLEALPPAVERFIYIGTTSVYGQTDGSWIDETSLCQPASEGGRVSIEAEAVLHASSLAERAIVLRLAGLYGPNRIPRREDLVSGKSLAADPAAFLNLIHVDDAARIVVAVEAQARPPCAYLVSDGCPVVRGEYYAEAARLLGAPQPTFAEADKRSKPDTRGNTDKRINNSRLITEIEFQLQYPSYKQGLAASIGSF